MRNWTTTGITAKVSTICLAASLILCAVAPARAAAAAKGEEASDSKHGYSEDAIRHYNRGHDLHQQGFFNQAISEYKAALERQQFVQARLGQLRQRLSKLSSIDPAQIPADRVGLGSRVEVQDEKSGSRETYYLVFGDAVEFEEGHVTMASPIGRALLGKAVGEVANLKLPTVARQLRVVSLRTIHDLTSADM